MKNKTAVVHYWYSDLEEFTGLKMHQEIPFDQLFYEVERVMRLGFYVMLKGYEIDGGEIMFAIDTTSFKQR